MIAEFTDYATLVAAGIRCWPFGAEVTTLVLDEARIGYSVRVVVSMERCLIAPIDDNQTQQAMNPDYESD